MNTPRGFTIRGGEVVDVDVWAAMFNPSTFAQTVHMWLAAVMVVGYFVASVYAVGMLRGRRSPYHRMGLLIPLTAAAVATPLQVASGDWLAGVVAEHQPVKLAAMEGHTTTDTQVPLSIGGIYVDGELKGAIEIPYGLSLLVGRDPDAEVPGLEIAPPEHRTPVNVTHLSYNAMIGIGTALLGLAVWLALSWCRRRDIPATPWFLRAVAVSGVSAIIAMESGWITTEVGRQPWIVYQVQLTRDAVSTAPGLRYGFYAVLAVYVALTVITVYVLRRLRHGETVAPQELARDEVTDSGPGMT